VLQPLGEAVWRQVFAVWESCQASGKQNISIFTREHKKKGSWWGGVCVVLEDREANFTSENLRDSFLVSHWEDSNQEQGQEILGKTIRVADMAAERIYSFSPTFAFNTPSSICVP
jgi:hypothetical protein